MSAATAERVYRITLPPKFKPIFRPHRYKAIFGGRGSAKSHSIAAALVVKAAERRLRVLCCREIQRSIRDSVKKLLDDKIAEMGLQGYFRSTDTEIRGPHGSGFIFAGLRSHIDTIKSMEAIDIAWVEEAHTVAQSSLDVLIPTIRQPDSELWFSWNPHHAKDPVDAMFRGPMAPPESLILNVNHGDNQWFPEVLRREMEWDRRRDPVKAAHIWDGDYIRNSEAQVFKNWRIGDPNEFKYAPDTHFYYGADWGFASDPSALVRCYLDGRTLYVDFEAYEVGCDIDKTPFLFGGCEDEELRKLNTAAFTSLGSDRYVGVPDSRKWTITADSARPETIRYMQTHGFPRMRGATKGAGSVEDGIEFLRSYDIVIHPRCLHAVDEFTFYQYKTDKITGEVLPILPDKKNHCIDAIRYAIEEHRRKKKQWGFV